MRNCLSLSVLALSGLIEMFLFAALRDKADIRQRVPNERSL
jgi:hypothetical protein